MNRENTYTFNQPGNGTNIGIAQNVSNCTYNIYIPTSNNAIGIMPQQSNKMTLNLDYFNLFVINQEKYENQYFMVDVKRALTVAEGTSQKIHDRLAVFSDEAISEIITYPAIFASENYRYSPPEIPTNEPQMAYYGIITNIKQMNNGKLKIFYAKFPCSIPQALLNQMIVELDINGSAKINELDRTHWAIKNVNLIDEMRAKGISLFVPSI